ncbi:hypothetical protein EDC01DRAFT_630658 [Geopyxis carbonaria]|nr:hypothetical protein EDC01DRAFT_630658 [Geopyxis carbonaria]
MNSPRSTNSVGTSAQSPVTRPPTPERRLSDAESSRRRTLSMVYDRYGIADRKESPENLTAGRVTTSRGVFPTELPTTATLIRRRQSMRIKARDSTQAASTSSEVCVDDGLIDDDQRVTPLTITMDNLRINRAENEEPDKQSAQESREYSPALHSNLSPEVTVSDHHGSSSPATQTSPCTLASCDVSQLHYLLRMTRSNSLRFDDLNDKLDTLKDRLEEIETQIRQIYEENELRWLERDSVLYKLLVSGDGGASLDDFMARYGQDVKSDTET